MLTAPLFLIGLVAVGIPIAIHLLQLRRYRKVYFSNVEMLEALQNESRKQNNLRRLLILLARIAAIVFLVLAFCQPVIPNKNAQLQAGGTVVSVYLDNSYSMQSGGMEGSLIESAKKKAREIAEAYRPDVQFQLLTNDAHGAQFRWLSREEFLAAVDEVEVSAVTAKLSSVAERQNEFLHSASAANRHAYIVSDFQRSTADVADYPADSAILATFIPLGGTEVANIYIDSLAFNSPAYFREATVRVEVTVRNDGSKGVESLPLRLFVGGKQRALTSVDIAPQGRATATMAFTIEDEGVLQGYVETTDYPITFDDRMFFSLSVTHRVPMLAISGAGENPNMQRLFAGDSLVEYHQVAVSQVDYAHLTDNRFIVLDELHTISSGMAHTLQEFVADGGSLLVIPGQEVETSSYNQFFAAMRMPQLGAWIGGQTRAETVELEADLYRGVFRGKKEEMEMPSVTGHYRLTTTATTVSQSLIRLLDGSDLLTETQVGNGHCYLLSAPLRKEHTDFVQQALFVPTLYNMALFSSPVQSPYHMLTATEPIPLTGSYDAEEVPHLLSVDGGVDVIPDIRRMGAVQCMVPHGDLSAAGNYLLSNSGEAEEGLSFNYSRQESDLAFYDRDEVKKLIADAHLDHCSVVTTADKSMTDYIRQRSQGTPLWRWCILLTLLALLAEILLIRLPQRKNLS